MILTSYTLVIEHTGPFFKYPCVQGHSASLVKRYTSDIAWLAILKLAIGSALTSLDVGGGLRDFGEW